jgi:hypothetical protein
MAFDALWHKPGAAKAQCSAKSVATMKRNRIGDLIIDAGDIFWRTRWNQFGASL